MFDFLKKKKAQPLVSDERLEDLREKFEDPDRSKQVEVTGTVLQIEKTRGVHFGPVEDIFHLVVKPDSECEYADSNGFVVIRETGKFQIPLAHEGDKITFGYWTNIHALQIFKFTIDFSIRKPE